MVEGTITIEYLECLEKERGPNFVVEQHGMEGQKWTHGTVRELLDKARKGVRLNWV